MTASPKVSRRRFATSLATLSFLAAGAPLSAQVSLTGAGATFPAPIYQKWFSQYQTAANVQINYQPIGSGGGIKNVTEGVVDFGASDGPMNDEQIKAFKDKHGYGILHFPTVIGAAVLSYNLPGVSEEINFTPEAIAGIFLGKITTWNDPELAKANPGMKLPSDKIVVVHRSDSSGTTYCWTDYLSKVSPEWSSKVGKNTAVSWPVGIGAKGSDGVAGTLKLQTGSIGYIELTYAVKNHLPYGKVKNKAGKFVKPDLESVTAAAAGAAKNMPDDFRVSIVDSPGAQAYPVSTFTWLLIPEKIPDTQKQTAIVGFLKWALSSGQNSVEALDYAKLPQAVVSKEQKTIGMIK